MIGFRNQWIRGKKLKIEEREKERKKKVREGGVIVHVKKI